jgi:hypothetical protein
LAPIAIRGEGGNHFLLSGVHLRKYGSREEFLAALRAPAEVFERSTNIDDLRKPETRVAKLMPTFETCRWRATRPSANAPALHISLVI